PGRFTGITITVKDVEACYRHLLSLGVAFHEPPVKQPWGGVMAFFDDPGGNTQTLCQLP
ncbi:MAG: hypothetical protein GWO02_22070, partial [Gammaproteobacteria bacterium]|nr:hypothetical protein [Gammaproteobacteria bacterium]